MGVGGEVAPDTNKIFMEETNMKKIIATVLAMVMALALCTVAFAAADTYDSYAATSANIKAGKLVSGAVKAKTAVTITTVAATKNSDGTGNLEYLTIDGESYVKTTSPTVSDFAITAADKTDILFYVTKVTAPTYEASAKAFTNFGYKCDQIVNTDNSKYYEVTTGANEGKIYKEAETGMNVLVDGKIVTVATTETATKPHTWAVSASKVENGVIVPTEVTCGVCGSKSTAIYKVGKAPAGSKVVAVPNFEDYVFVPGGVAGTTTGTTTSPKTFDAGIAMYVGMALTSVAGSAVVIGKKKEF